MHDNVVFLSFQGPLHWVMNWRERISLCSKGTIDDPPLIQSTKSKHGNQVIRQTEQAKMRIGIGWADYFDSSVWLHRCWRLGQRHASRAIKRSNDVNFDTWSIVEQLNTTTFCGIRSELFMSMTTHNGYKELLIPTYANKLPKLQIIDTFNYQHLNL